MKPQRTKTPNMRPKKTVTVVTISVLLVLLIILVWPRKTEQPTLTNTGRTDVPGTRSITEEVPASSSSNISNPSSSAVLPPRAATNVTGRVDKETMLRQLKSWIRKREGYEVQIVSSQDILDLKGNPASLNVLVTSLTYGELTAEKLKAGLDDAAAKEHALREQLAKAKQDEDIAGVNRLVAELIESRTAFVTNNGVSSYKLNLRKELPPVLAFWPGLPFETVREASARNLAATRLGGGVGLQGLVHFTSATALLRFTNSAGGSVYVDPFRMTEVSQNTLQTLSQGARQRDDAERDSRIAAQWADYLQP